MDKSFEENNFSHLGTTQIFPLGWDTEGIKYYSSINVIDLNEGMLSIIFSKYINILNAQGIIDTQRLFLLYIIEDLENSDNSELLVTQDREEYTVVHKVKLTDLKNTDEDNIVVDFVDKTNI